MHKQPKLTRFNENVLAKYQIYNSIFMTLPFDAIGKTGVLLPLFHEIFMRFVKMASKTKRIHLRL